MPQIMQPALQARPGGCFMEGVRTVLACPHGLYQNFS